MILPNQKPKKPVFKDKLVFKDDDYMTALYLMVKAMGGVILPSVKFEELSDCKEKLIVEFSAETKAYRIRLRPQKRGIITRQRKLILPG